MNKRTAGNVPENESKNTSSFSHLKWPAIIMAILMVILIAALDYCSRNGNL